MAYAVIFFVATSLNQSCLSFHLFINQNRGHPFRVKEKQYNVKGKRDVLAPSILFLTNKKRTAQMSERCIGKNSFFAGAPLNVSISF